MSKADAKVSFEAHTLRQVCSLISSGGTPSRTQPAYFTSDTDGHLWVKSKELLDRSLGETEERITEAGLRNSSAKYYPANAVLMAMYGANVGQLGWLRHPATVNQAVCGMVVDESVAHYRYVFYALLHGRGELVAQARGAAQQNLNQDLIRDFAIPLPPLPTQRIITAILSAYDDLIEVNTRRIALLEEMAAGLYREWFVRFRFPGHERVRMVESAVGVVPEGWEVGRLDDALVLQRGFDLPNGQRRDGDIPIYAATGVVGTHDEAKVRGPGVVTGRSGSLGTVIYIEDDFWPLNTALWVKEFRRVTPTFAYYLLNDLDLRQFNSGAAVPTLNRNDIHGLPVVIPPTGLLDQFDNVVLPMYDLRKNLRAKNANLRRTRDLLLPRLVAGEG